MYSTRLKVDSDRYIARCIVNDRGPRVVDFVVDTGAKYTCCNASSISGKLQEEQFKDADTKLLGGIIAGSALKVYKYHVEQFTIGTIDLGSQNIWITFDKRATDDVLGMDILKQVYFMQDSVDLRIMFSLDKCDFTLI